MRRSYCITYDIADDKRRDKVFTMLHGFGDRAQYSVFFCELSPQELVTLRGRLRQAIHGVEDQVLIIDLGKGTKPLESGIEALGKGYNPPTRTVVI